MTSGTLFEIGRYGKVIFWNLPEAPTAPRVQIQSERFPDIWILVSFGRLGLSARDDEHGNIIDEAGTLAELDRLRPT